MAFGWAIIGTGMHPHLKVAPAMNLVKGAELVAVYSRSQERAETFAENHDAKFTPARRKHVILVRHIVCKGPASVECGGVLPVHQILDEGRHASEPPIHTCCGAFACLIESFESQCIQLRIDLLGPIDCSVHDFCGTDIAIGDHFCRAHTVYKIT